MKWVVLAALLLSLFLNTAMPLCVRAQDPGKEAQGSKVVRVGWYDSTYNTIDEYGRRSGYAYEYQLKLSAYSGWTYEYVAGSWSDLLHMLENGEIDLMSDVSYTPEREKKMMFPSLPMGIEDYYIFTAPGNDTISRKDPATLNGKRVGVNKDSIQADFYVNWEKDNDVHAEIIELTTPESESLQMLEDGALDAYITVDSFTDATQAIPVFKIGSSEYYFAVSNSRPDLMVELNAALARIQEENRYYN
ncbi:MAG: transporter substrate-binding domain-containing protein [Lachnospiraceae bacterium]|nr:transporter substrate-binding domain-containing protein [Lachnospiraceae bacterium]